MVNISNKWWRWPRPETRCSTMSVCQKTLLQTKSGASRRSDDTDGWSKYLFGVFVSCWRRHQHHWHSTAGPFLSSEGELSVSKELLNVTVMHETTTGGKTSMQSVSKVKWSIIIASTIIYILYEPVLCWLQKYINLHGVHQRFAMKHGYARSRHKLPRRASCS